MHEYAKYKIHSLVSVCWCYQHTLKQTRQRKRCHEVWVMLIKFVVPLYMCLTSSQVGLIDSFASLLFLLLFVCLFFFNLSSIIKRDYLINAQRGAGAMCEKKYWNLIKHEGEVRMGKKRTRLYEAQEGVRAFASFSWEWFIWFCYPVLWSPVGKSSSTTTWAPVKPTWTLPKSSQNILVPQVFRQIINFVPFLSFPVFFAVFFSLLTAVS